MSHCRNRIATPVEFLVDQGTWTGRTDAHLLDRYVRMGDRQAFEVLAARHGPMVMGVCRRILAEPSDADDAFQATFLVLIRRAGSLGPTDVLAAWLHGVATRVARRARMDRARRRVRERDGLAVEPGHEPDSPDFALRGVIDEELERLPWKYRAPVALCHLEGLTHEEAAARLGWPVGSVKGRLARARSLLGPRLARRGVMAGAGTLALEDLASAAVPAALTASVATAAGRVAEGVAWKSALSYSVVRLAKGVCTAMIVPKLTAALAVAAAVAVAAGGGIAAARPDGQEPSAAELPPTVAEAVAEAPESRQPAQAEAPAATPSRSGADRLLTAAKEAFQAASRDLGDDPGAIDRFYRASRLWLDAQQALATDAEARKAAFAGHRDRMRHLIRAPFTSSRGGGDSATPIRADARALVAEAELWADQGGDAPRPAEPSAPETPKAAGPAAGNGPGDGVSRSAAVLEQLEAPLPLHFPNQTPLEDVLKYIKQATQMSIYIDPIGLTEAGREITSPVKIDVEGVPLRWSLQRMLAQLGLAYAVKNGFLMITSIQSAESTEAEPAARASLDQEVAKAIQGRMTTEAMRELVERLRLIEEIQKLHRSLKAGEAEAHAPLCPCRHPSHPRRSRSLNGDG